MLPDGSDSGRSAKARRATRLSVIFRERRSASYPAIPKGIGRSRCPRPIGNTEPAAVWPDSGLVDVDKTGELAPCRLHRLAVCWQSPSRQGGRYPPQSGSSPRLCHPHLNDILVAAKQLNPLVYNTVVLGAGICPASANARSWLTPDWTFGAKPERARRSRLWPPRVVQETNGTGRTTGPQGIRMLDADGPVLAKAGGAQCLLRSVTRAQRQPSTRST
jgi:hypothetical protein